MAAGSARDQFELLRDDPFPLSGSGSSGDPTAAEPSGTHLILRNPNAERSPCGLPQAGSSDFAWGRCKNVGSSELLNPLVLKMLPLEDSCFLCPGPKYCSTRLHPEMFHLPILVSSAILLLQGLSRLGTEVLTHLY